VRFEEAKNRMKSGVDLAEQKAASGQPTPHRWRFGFLNVPTLSGHHEALLRSFTRRVPVDAWGLSHLRI